MLPGARGALVTSLIPGPRQFRFERLKMTDRQQFELRPGIAVMLNGRGIDPEDALIVQRADDHRDRIAVEQQPKRSLALLQFSDIDPQADDATVRGKPL